MITLYRGARGTGKTLTMVKDGYKYLKEGWLVYTNLSKSPFKPISAREILSIDGKSNYFNLVLVIDEIELFFDSREWKKEESHNFGKFLQQIRKRNVIILCTAQFTDLIEKRLRQQIDRLAICSFDKDSFISRTEYIDLTSIESGYIESFICEYYSQPIFDLYDTLEIILTG